MRSTDERRKHLRYSYFVDLEYMLNPRTSDEIFKCAVVNISDCGMGLLISRLFHLGEKITIKSDLPNLARTVVVRWINKFHGVYQVGVEYDDDSNNQR